MLFRSTRSGGYKGVLPFIGLYQKLGYQPFRRVYHFQASAPLYPSFDLTPFPIYFEEDRLQKFLNQTFGNYDGFIPLDSNQWKWRKKERPPNLPAKLLATGKEEIEATITQNPGKIIIQGKEEKALFLSDWGGQSFQSKMEALLLALPPFSKGKIDILCPQVNREDWQLLKQTGFFPTLPEQAMLFPLTPQGKTLMNQAEGNFWYPLIESMVGV